MASISTLLSLRKPIGNMQPTLSESSSLQYHLRLSRPTLTASSIFSFAQAPRRWAVYTNPSATILCNLLTYCSMNSSPIYVPYFLRIFSNILSTKVQMTKPIIPIPIFLFSTPMITPTFLNELSTLELGNSTPPPIGNTIKAVWDRSNPLPSDRPHSSNSREWTRTCPVDFTSYFTLLCPGRACSSK